MKFVRPYRLQLHERPFCCFEIVQNATIEKHGLFPQEIQESIMNRTFSARDPLSGSIAVCQSLPLDPDQTTERPSGQGTARGSTNDCDFLSTDDMTKPASDLDRAGLF